MEIACLQKACGMTYKFPHIYHVVAGLIISLKFFREDPNGVIDKVKIFLLTNLSLSAGSEEAMVPR